MCSYFTFVKKKAKHIQGDLNQLALNYLNFNMFTQRERKGEVTSTEVGAHNTKS